MNEPFTKANIENWLVEFLTSPSTMIYSYPDDCSALYTNKNGKRDFSGPCLFINPPRSPFAPLNIFGPDLIKSEEIGNMKENIRLDHLSERALALLAIIHRPAYEFYKKHWKP